MHFCDETWNNMSVIFQIQMRAHNVHTENLILKLIVVASEAYGHNQFKCTDKMKD